jgi:hypothetical protein
MIPVPPRTWRNVFEICEIEGTRWFGILYASVHALKGSGKVRASMALPKTFLILVFERNELQPGEGAVWREYLGE